MRDPYKWRGKKRAWTSVQDRLSVEEIYEIIDGDSHLTFDFCLNTFYAAIIAALGLATDSGPTVVASMLISPLMGPIMAITFGIDLWINCMNKLLQTSQ